MNAPDSPAADPPRVSNAPLPRAGELPPKRLYRDPKGPIGGVAGGFAGYFDVDPVIPRLLWVFALLSGIGFPAYLLCWIVIPKAQSWPPPGYQGRPAAGGGAGHDTSSLLSGLLIIALAAVIGVGVDGVGDFILPAALVGFGVFLLSRRERDEGGGPGAADAARVVGGAGSVGADAGDVDVPGGPGGAAAHARHGLVTPTVISLLAIGAGVMAALHAASLVPLSITGIAAGGLVVVGAGLVASSWLGPARGLVPLGLGLATVMLGAATVGPWIDEVRDGARMVARVDGAPSEAMGELSFEPDTLAALMPRYDLGMGKLTLDLTELDFTGETRAVEVNVGLGELLVILPPGVSADVSGDVGAGEVDALGVRRKGLGNSVQHRDEGTHAGTLAIELNVGLGKAQVLRGTP